MALLESCTALSKSFSSRILFENISLGISEGERLGLIGRNGSGKTTLLKILSGRMEPDSGAVSMRRNTHVGYVPQEAVFPAGKTVAEIIAEPIAAERLDHLERAARIHDYLRAYDANDAHFALAAARENRDAALAIETSDFPRFALWSKP